MRASLTLEAGDSSPNTLHLTADQAVTLGRSRDNAVVIRDDMVSRLHAKIYFEDGRWVIRDFGLNGTKVNGLRVSGSTELPDGAAVQIGDTRFAFASAARASAVTPVPGQLGSGVVALRAAARSGGLRDDPRPVPTSAVTPVSTPRNKPAGNTAVVRAAETRGTKVHPNLARETPPPAADPDLAASRLKLDELSALCKYMQSAVQATDPKDLIRLALRTVLTQTAAKVAGYLSLDPNDPLPKLVLPAESPVDVQLSKRLTDRVRQTGKMVWLFEERAADRSSDSLSAFTDAACLPLAAADGPPFAALHVYRTGVGFAEQEVKFLEAVAGYLARGLDTHRHRRKLEAENNRLRAVVPAAEELIGDSSAMMNLRSQIAKAAPLPFTVLIHGESGAGKELVALALHRNSARDDGPLVVVNCAAIAPTLLEAELFGYRKGAFSGADRDHPGFFEQADEGTLFLDEVGELSPECQAKLLRVIEGKAFRPVGARADVKVDVRVIAATHRDLEREAAAGRFRQDLLFRLKVIGLKVPALRDHAEDIPELARFFLERLSVQCRRSFRLTPDALAKLQSFPWPGNVRQLRAVLESAAVMTESDAIDADALPLGGPPAPAAPPPVTTPADLPASLDVDELETWAIRKAMRQTHGNVSRAAQILGMSRDTLHTKLKKKGIDRDELLAGPVAAQTAHE